MQTIKFKDHTVTYDDSQETKEKVFQAVMDWFNKYEAYSGECICQSDDTTITAHELLSDIADDIIKFDVKWED